MNRFFVICILVLFSLVSLVSADSYDNLGKLNGLFTSQAGIFNAALTSYSLTSKSLNDGTQSPLVSDLDGDGVNEIIVIDGQNLRLYDPDLGIVDTFSLKANERTSNLIAYDIDGDGYKELILIYEISNFLDIIEYNGTHVINETSMPFNAAGVSHIDGETMLRCGDLNNCLAIYTTLDDTTSGTDVYAVPFNSSALGSQITLEADASTSTVGCLPKIKYIAYNDTDNDGNKEYVASFFKAMNVADDFIFLTRIYVNSSNVAVLEKKASFDSNGLFRDINPITSFGSTDVCLGKTVGNYFTPPLIYDIDGSVSNGMETIVGINVDNDEFTMASYDKDFNFLDDYPEFFNADGKIISNVMLADVFGDTGKVDFCVIGHSDTFEELDMICGSEQSGATYETYEFKKSTANLFNVTQDYGNLNVLSHSGQHSGDFGYIGGHGINYPDEFVTSYGVLQVTGEDYNGSSWIFDMNLIFSMPVEDTSCIPVDAENIGSVDFICMDSGGIYYIDDGLSGEPAEITEITFNPCPIDTIIKVNETLEIYVTVDDGNNELIGLDNVNSRVHVYYGDSNVMVQNTTNTSSGVVHTYSFTLNKTISGGSIYVQGWDEGSPTEIDAHTITPLTVASNGVEFGDSTCTVDYSAVSGGTGTTTPDNESITPAADNLVKRSLIEVNNYFHVGLFVIWIFIIVLIDIILVANAHSYFKDLGAKYLFAVILFVDFIMLILGAIFSVISYWVIALLLVIGVAIVIIFVVNKFQGSAGV